MRAPRAGVALLLLALGCKTASRDPFLAAERALLNSDLPVALQQFDAVSVAHPRYPEARAAAAGVERRMRRSHECLLDGLLLRAEWRDREALAALQRARQIWPALPGVAVLIQATEQRLALFAAQDAGTAIAAANPAVTVVPLPSPDDLRVPELAAVPAAPIGEGLGPAPVVEPPRGASKDPPRDDAVAQKLVDVEAQLGRGDLAAAVGALFRLAAQYPKDARIRVRLVRVLHQRALLRYGSGSLAEAITDWESLLQLDPTHAVARSLLEAARAETAGNTARGH